MFSLAYPKNLYQNAFNFFLCVVKTQRRLRPVVMVRETPEALLPTV